MRHVLLLSFGLLVVLLAGCVPVGPQGAATSTQYVREKVLRYADAEYEPGIRSVLLVPNTGQLSDDMQYPFIGLGTANNLRLEFDEMGSQCSNYYDKLCARYDHGEDPQKTEEEIDYKVLEFFIPN
jgi:hypothetical protein